MQKRFNYTESLNLSPVTESHNISSAPEELFQFLDELLQFVRDHLIKNRISVVEVKFFNYYPHNCGHQAIVVLVKTIPSIVDIKGIIEISNYNMSMKKRSPNPTDRICMKLLLNMLVSIETYPSRDKVFKYCLFDWGILFKWLTVFKIKYI